MDWSPKEQRLTLRNSLRSLDGLPRQQVIGPPYKYVATGTVIFDHIYFAMTHCILLIKGSIAEMEAIEEARATMAANQRNTGNYNHHVNRKDRHACHN